MWPRPFCTLMRPLASTDGVRPNSPLTTTTVSFSRPDAFRFHDQRGDRPIGLAGRLAVDKNIVMAVPGYIFPKIDLRHAHAALDESAGYQAATSEVSVPCRRAKESRSC